MIAIKIVDWHKKNCREYFAILWSATSNLQFIGSAIFVCPPWKFYWQGESQPEEIFQILRKKTCAVHFVYRAQDKKILFDWYILHEYTRRRHCRLAMYWARETLGFRKNAWVRETLDAFNRIDAFHFKRASHHLFIQYRPKNIAYLQHRRTLAADDPTRTVHSHLNQPLCKPWSVRCNCGLIHFDSVNTSSLQLKSKFKRVFSTPRPTFEWKSYEIQ